MEQKQINEDLQLAAKLIAFGIGIYAVKKVGEEFGLFQTKDEKDVEDAQGKADADPTKVDPKNPYLAFNPNYAAAIVQAYNKKFKSKGKVFNGTWNLNGLTEMDYKVMANQLLNAPALFNDDEDVVYSIFRKIQTQWQLSILSLAFQTIYQKDLLKWLAKPSGFMSGEEMNGILNIIKNYPQYRANN